MRNELRAAWWTLRAVRQARRQLRRSGLAELSLAPPPHLPEEATSGMLAVIRRLPNTCLERSVVFQRWLASYGQYRDVIVGVTNVDGEFRAHAWLDGEEVDVVYRELTRVAPPGSR